MGDCSIAAIRIIEVSGHVFGGLMHSRLRHGGLWGSLGCCLIVANGLGFQAHEIVRITIFYQFFGSDLTRSRAW